VQRAIIWSMAAPAGYDGIEKGGSALDRAADGERRGGRAVNVLLTLRVNGEERNLVAPVHKTLLEVLREELDLTGTKHGCELGECGACAVLVDGEPILSCLALPIELQAPQHEIVTVEGLASAEPHPLQRAFGELGAAQCGYCTPGFLVTAAALLDADPAPSREKIVAELAGNICRCTGYSKIFEAVELAAARMRGEAPTDARSEALA
jgi:aerobic-type carbon monoxide dehydrogenase small subunit (CoxS/CutS family)